MFKSVDWMNLQKTVDRGDQRGIDLLCPVWHVLDLTPEGRDDWYAELEYGEQ